MRHLLLPVIICSLFLAGCNITPDQRIARHRVYFDGLPGETQALIRKGIVELGFEPKMVELALGEPSRVSKRVTATGETELWIYESGGGSFSVGVGVGVGSPSSYGGIGSHSTSSPRETIAVVEFQHGKVTQIELRKK